RARICSARVQVERTEPVDDVLWRDVVLGLTDTSLMGTKSHDTPPSKAMSQPRNCRLSLWAACITTNEPAAGSQMMSPGSVVAAIRRLMSPIGLMCGWSLRSTFSLQRERMP